jgi:hypothetical protein
LWALRLSDARLSPDGLRTVAALHNLWRLDLDGAALADADLRHLAGMRGLRHLSLRGCRGVTDAGVAALQRALPGCCIER